jgi:hypothetical protein
LRRHHGADLIDAGRLQAKRIADTIAHARDEGKIVKGMSALVGANNIQMTAAVNRRAKLFWTGAVQ